MYIAELRGKLSREQENKEDILTSNVFSFLKYAPRETFLIEYINSLGIPVSKEDSFRAKFLFWTTFRDLTEPDVVIVIGDYYLLFEAKLLLGFGEETEFSSAQLFREIEGGLAEADNVKKNFKLIAITSDYFQPVGLFKKIPAEYHQYLLWTNWQHFTFLLSSVLESRSDLSTETRLFGQDLYSLLDKKRLRRFEGCRALAVKEYPFRPFETIFFSEETAKYRGDFIGFLNALPNNAKIIKAKDILFYSTNRRFFLFNQTIQPVKEFPTNPLFYSGDNNE
ncbi:hypothetical protein KA005_27610 [bacterium]|nr:hypothetical protein [bacterium]